MSRSGYSEDCEHLNLWRSNVERTIRGKKGQLFLKDLLQALDEMPNKRLIRESLANDGEFCALGALGHKKYIDMEPLDPEDPDQVASVFGISSMLVQEIVYKNDETYYRETPENRWIKMREWVKQQIVK